MAVGVMLADLVVVPTTILMMLGAPCSKTNVAVNVACVRDCALGIELHMLYAAPTTESITAFSTSFSTT